MYYTHRLFLHEALDKMLIIIIIYGCALHVALMVFCLFFVALFINSYTHIHNDFHI